MSGRTLAIPPQYHYGLPAGAKMMVPWVQGNVEVRIPVGCSHPFAINSDPGGWFWSRAEARIVLDKVDQRFRRLRLRNLLSRVGLYLELDFRTAASRRNTHRVILRSHRCRNKNNRTTQNSKYRLGHVGHSLAPARPHQENSSSNGTAAKRNLGKLCPRTCDPNATS
jgi:hypothetical protein